MFFALKSARTSVFEEPLLVRKISH